MSLLAAALLVPRGAGALMVLRLGEAPPPFDLADLSGKRVGSDSFTGGATVVLFWSTWSPRSAEMFHDFKRHAAAYSGKGLKIVAINNDGENLGVARKAAILEYAAARELPFLMLLDEGLKASADWGVMADPTEVVLDAGGRIAYVLPGYPETLRDELEEAIKKVLGMATRPTVATQALSAPQEESLALAGLGRQFLAKGDPERAREAFRRAAAADPTSLEAINRGDLRYLLGSLMLFKGDLGDAERTFRVLQDQLPAEGWGHWGLGLVVLARGDHRGALASMEQAARLQPENPVAAAFVWRYFRDSCQRQESFAEEAGFVKIFPALAETRERYCRVFAPRLPASEKAAP